MGVGRRQYAMGAALVGILLVATITYVAAQEGAGDLALIDGGGTVAAAASAEALDGADLAMAQEEPLPVVTVAQATPPPAPVTSEEEAAPAPATPPALLSERAWSDGVTTIVECTGEVARTCQVNVYHPGGEFILGRTITPSGEAADCSGPCLDSTGAQLDASSIARAQSAIAAGSQTHRIITSAGAPVPPAAVVQTSTDVEAEPLRVEGN